MNSRRLPAKYSSSWRRPHRPSPAPSPPACPFGPRAGRAPDPAARPAARAARARAPSRRAGASRSGSRGRHMRGGSRRLHDTVHRCIAAYPRHGRHATAARPTSAAVAGRPLTSACRSPRSDAGNASGSPAPRIATYSAVQGPMPGSATRLERSTSGLEARSRSSPPSRPRRQARIVPPRARGMPIASTGAAASTVGAGKTWVSAPSPAASSP